MTKEEFNKCLKLAANRIDFGMEQIYKKYHDKLIFSTMLDGKTKVDAEDIVSTMLFSIWRNAAKYDYIEKPNAWMWQSLQYAIINYKKQNSKYVSTENIDKTFYSNNSNTEFKIELRKAVEKLTKRQQAIFQLHYLYDFEIEDTAEQLKISRSTVNRKINIIKEELDYLNYF